MMTQIFVYK